MPRLAQDHSIEVMSREHCLPKTTALSSKNATLQATQCLLTLEYIYVECQKMVAKTAIIERRIESLQCEHKDTARHLCQLFENFCSVNGDVSACALAFQSSSLVGVSQMCPSVATQMQWR